MSGERLFVVYDGTRFRTDLFDDTHVEVYPAKEAALLAADQMNDGFNGFLVAPEGGLVKARPWKAHELVEVKHDGAGQTGPGEGKLP